MCILHKLSVFKLVTQACPIFYLSRRSVNKSVIRNKPDNLCRVTPVQTPVTNMIVTNNKLGLLITEVNKQCRWVLQRQRLNCILWGDYWRPVQITSALLNNGSSKLHAFLASKSIISQKQCNKHETHIQLALNYVT